jgi:Matrixin
MHRATWRGFAAGWLLICLVLALGLRTWQQEAAHAALGGYPPLPREAGNARLLPPGLPTGSTEYAFLQTLPDGAPVTYDPCRPIHYVIRAAHLPSYGVQLIQEAVARASAASGLKFVDDGLTSEPLTADRASVQTRYGDRWAPVLIAFSDARESPALANDVMGRGGSVSVAPDGPVSARYVTGQITLDQDDFDQTLGLVNGWADDRTAIMHELGHVLGLGHVRDRTQVMFPDNVGLQAYGAGDHQGLALEGSGRCHHDT